MCVARPIYGEDGRVLLNSGVILNESFIARLHKVGIPGVFILTEPEEMIDIPEIISQQTRQNAIRQVKNVFDSVQVGKTFDIGPISQSVNAIVDEIITKPNILVNLTDIRTYDGYTFAHSVNVCVLSVILGVKYQLNELELHELAMGAILHDVGKIGVASEILLKNGALTESEYNEVKKHTLYGWQILRDHPDIPLLSAHIAYQHHEQPNGKGYPRGLIDEQIYLYSKIVGVADAYDAMTSARVYRPAMQPSQALRVIKQLSGIQFNPTAAEYLISCVAPYPVGSRVMLNTQEIGIVVDVNQTDRTRPVVRILFHPDGSKCENQYEIDLAKEPALSIQKSV